MFQFGRNITGLIGGASINTIKRLLIPVPPIEEQEEIVIYLDTECGKIDKQMLDLNNQIELLHEMNKCVISDAVTGKIDVRNIEIPDYEFVDEDADSDADIDSNGEEKNEEQEE